MLELKEICELTGIDQSVLERAFSFRTVEAKQEKVSTTLNVAQVKKDVPIFKEIIVLNGDLFSITEP